MKGDTRYLAGLFVAGLLIVLAAPVALLGALMRKEIRL